MDPSREKFFKCFRPVFLPLFLTGCLSFRLNTQQQFEWSSFTKIYTILYRIIGPGCLIVGWGIKVQSGQYSEHLSQLSPLIQFLGFAELLITFTTYVEVWAIMDLEKHVHIELYERAYQLDALFSKEFNINFNYQKTVRKNSIYMTMLVLYCGSYYIMYIINLDPEWKVALIGLGYAMCAVGPGASTYAHISSMDYLRVRFRLLQRLLRKCLPQGSKQKIDNRLRIVSLIKYYQKYYEMIQGINNIYGRLAIATYFHNFTQISSMVFVLCHKASESRAPFTEYVFLFMFVLPRVVMVIYIAVYSRLTINESKACAQIIASYDDHYPMKEDIVAFLMWKKLNCFYFTVGKVLISNFGLTYFFFLGIGNYVLILIQLKLQEASIEDRLKVTI